MTRATPKQIQLLMEQGREVAAERNIEPRLILRQMLHCVGITCIDAADELINAHMRDVYSAR